MYHFFMYPLRWSILLAPLFPLAYAEPLPSALDQPKQLETGTAKLLPALTIAAQEDKQRLASSALSQFSQRALQLPLAESSIDLQEIRKHHILRVQDALPLLASVFMQDSYGGGGWDNYSVRGFSTDPNMGTAQLRNGLSAIAGIQLPKDMINVERLEFLKGPMAAIYGQATMGGMLNVVSKQPTWTPQKQLQLSASSLQQYRSALDLTDAINSDVAYRLGLAVENNQSFREHVDQHKYLIAPQLAWRLSDRTTLNLDSEIGEYRYVFDRGIVMDADGKIRMSKKNFLGEPDDGEVTVKQQLYQLRLQQQLNPDWQLRTALSYAQGQREGSSTEVSQVHADVADRFRRYRKFNTNTLQLQSILTGLVEIGSVRHQLMAGLEASHYQIEQIQRRNAKGSTSQINIHQPQYGQLLALSRISKSSEETQHNLAINLQDQIFLNTRLNLLLGARLDYMQQKIDDALLQHSDQQSYTPFSPRIGLNYLLRPNLSLYANWGKGFEMNTGLKDSSHTLFSPESSRSWEIGSKYQYAQQNWLSLSYFDMQKKHLLTEGINDSYVDNGRVQSRGIELSWHQQLLARLSLGLNYSYIDAQVLESEAEQRGNRLKNIPQHSGNLNLDYAFSWQDHDSGLLLNIQYYGQRSANYKDNGSSLPAFTLFSLGGFTQISPQLRLQLNIHNLFNRDYYLSSYTNYWIQPGEPRKATLSLSWDY